MNLFSVRPLQTSIFSAGQDLGDFVFASVPQEYIQEKMILAVTSKIVSLAENRLVPSSMDKKALVQQESDLYIGEIGYGCHLTIKNNLLIPSAGIDESNSANGDFILYPKDPFTSAQGLWLDLRRRWNLQKLGILFTDSHTSPLRRGVTGICLSYWGFRGVKNMIGSEDIFGRELKMTQMNLADGLAASAVLQMGEGRERRPLALLSADDIEFCEYTRPQEISIPIEQDLYYPLLKSFADQISRAQN